MDLRTQQWRAQFAKKMADCPDLGAAATEEEVAAALRRQGLTPGLCDQWEREGQERNPGAPHPYVTFSLLRRDDGLLEIQVGKDY